MRVWNPSTTAPASRGSMVSPARWRAQLRDVVAIGWLLLATTAVYVLLVLGTDEMLRPEQEAFLRLFVLPSLPLAAAVLLLRAREIVDVFLRLPFLSLFLVLMWASVAWSLDPAVSLRRASLVTAYTVIAVWLVIAYEPAALLRRLAWLFLAILLLSVVFAVAVPHLAWQPLEGRLLLRGVYAHKNQLGLHLGGTAMLMATAWQFRLIPRWAAGLGLALCLALAWPTGSATTFLILGILAVIRIILAIAVLPARQAAALAAFAIAAAVFLMLAMILAAETVVAALGRDLTLTGRVPLWQFAWLQIAAEPWRGYGFAVFFDIDWVEVYIMETLGWPSPNAHNGFLELWLGVGVGGPVLLIMSLCLGLFRALARLRRRVDPGAVFAVYVILTYLLRNIVESDLATPSHISWVLAVIALTLTLRPRSTADERPG
jgi:exopolysaccharide production protein ExoQ